MTADQRRANARMHANASRLGIDHSLLSEWADDVHNVVSTRDLTPDQMDELSKQMEREGGDFAAVFIDTYGPKSIMQPALLDVPETPVDRWVS